VISNKFSETWLQEPLEIEISKEGEDLAISFNDLISISSSPKERSEGFQWFLSFIASFSSEPEKNKQRKIFLLDEPALRLHPKGQKDLIKVIEKLSESNQFIYTTHSPFLVNRNFPQRIRLLEKNPKKGTIINNKPYSNGKTRLWEPLKSSIGICLGDLFSLGETNLIVEGISDEIIIAGISNKLAAMGEPFLDLNEITIVPATGADCVEYLAKFALSEGLPSISLLDNDSEGKRSKAEIQKEKGINCLSVDDLKKGAVTLEDVLPEPIYVSAVNSFYSKFEKYVGYKLDGNVTSGIINRLSCHFETVGLNFDKVSVARELIQQTAVDEQALPQYEPFKKLFEIVNKMNKTKSE
jgi:predicted ATP-dependent endonuclease of OLD family